MNKFSELTGIVEDFNLENINLKNKNYKTGLVEKSKFKMFD